MTRQIIQSRFLVTDFTYACDPTGMLFTCVTDNECTLKLRLCYNKPSFSQWHHKKRGITQTHDIYLVPQVWATINQNEPADSLTHSFLIPDPESGHEYWWFLNGWKAGVELFSISQLFHYACLIEWEYHLITIPADTVAMNLGWAPYIAPTNDPYCPDAAWKTNPCPQANDGAGGSLYYHRQYAYHTYRWTLWRSHFRFNTATLGAGAIPTWAQLHVYCNVPPATNDQAALVTVPAFTPWTAATAKSHYSDIVVGSNYVAGFDNDYNGYRYVDKIFNDAGLNHIDPTGWTHFAVVRWKDLQRTSMPLGYWAGHAFRLIGTNPNRCELQIQYKTPIPP